MAEDSITYPITFERADDFSYSLGYYGTTKIYANEYAPTTEIPAFALESYPNVTYFEVADTVTSLQSHAFEFGSKNLAEVHFVNEGKQVTSIGKSAFRGCVALRKINIPLGVTEIPETCFAGCSELESVQMHPGITKIGENAFAFCKKLRRMDFYEGLQTMEANAFSDVNLKSLHFHGKINPGLHKPNSSFLGAGDYPETIWVDRTESLREAKKLFPEKWPGSVNIKFNSRLSSPETYTAIVNARTDQKDDEAAKFSEFVQTVLMANSRETPNIPYLPKEIMLEILKNVDYQDTVDTTRSVVPIGFPYWVSTQYTRYRNLLRQLYDRYKFLGTTSVEKRVEEVGDTGLINNIQTSAEKNVEEIGDTRLINNI